MAKKKAEAEVKYDEIHTKDMGEVVSDAAKPTDELEPTPAAEEKPAEAPPTPEEEEIEFDPQKFKEEVATEIKNTIIDSIKGKSADDKQETLDEYDKFVKETMDKQGRNPTWKEAMLFLKEEMKRDEAKAKEDAKKQEEEKNQQEQEFEKQLNSQIDDELNELYEANKLPKIKDPKDENDRGVIARKALFQTMLDVNQQRQKEGKPVIYSIHRIYNNYYKPPRQQPAGADAPVSAGKSNASMEGDDTIKYEDIHKKSWRELLFGNK